MDLVNLVGIFPSGFAAVLLTNIEALADKLSELIFRSGENNFAHVPFRAVGFHLRSNGYILVRLGVAVAYVENLKLKNLFARCGVSAELDLLGEGDFIYEHNRLCFEVNFLIQIQELSFIPFKEIYFGSLGILRHGVGKMIVLKNRNFSFIIYCRNVFLTGVLRDNLCGAHIKAV